MFVCSSVCAPRDPAADTVKIDMPRKAEQEEADRHAAEELQTQIRAEDAQEVQRRAQEEEEARNAEDVARFALEEAAQRRAEEERLRQREEDRRAEKARREREAAVVEARSLEEERSEDERVLKVAAFLTENKFTSTSAGKKTMLSTTYAIHTAAVCGDEEMVKMLIKEGANPKQKNSSGKTAAQVAERKNRKGSHAAVLLVLGGT